MDCCNAVKINFKKGRYHFMSAEPYGLKYLKILCTKGNISIESIALTETVCPMPITFKYESQDKEINKILNAAKETFIQNSFDFFTDCPTRERAGWLCDSFFLGRAEATFTGQNTIERFFLENYLLTDDYENIPEGMLAYCYPADVDSNGFIPNWAMWFVLELFDYGERTGDNEFVALFKDKVYRLLAWFEKYENCDGLIEKLPGWVFVEWSAANQFVQDINFPSNMLYALMLETASLLYNDTYLKDKAANLKELIRRRSFDGEFFRDNEVYENGIPQPTDNCSETCQYYAFYTKVATPERYPELWDKLLADFGPKRPENVYPSIYPSNAFIGNILRLDLLCQTGNYRQLIKEIKEYYLYMAERTGTLWENIDTSASCNHGFAAYIAGLIKTAEQSV